MADPGDASISWTADEVLVLFELLHRWEDDDRVTAAQHAAEQVALWNLSASLERDYASRSARTTPLGTGAVPAGAE